MLWVTRSHVHVDRVACPWLIRRFVDSDAEFLFVPKNQVEDVATSRGGTPFDIPGVELGHHDGKCSFEAILAKYDLTDPGLQRLARIVHAADIAAELHTDEIALPGWRRSPPASGSSCRTTRRISKRSLLSMTRSMLGVGCRLLLRGERDKATYHHGEPAAFPTIGVWADPQDDRVWRPSDGLDDGPHLRVLSASLRFYHGWTPIDETPFLPQSQIRPKG